MIEILKVLLMGLGCVSIPLFFIACHALDSRSKSEWFRRVRLASLTCFVYAKDGTLQPGSRVYSDTERIEVHAVLVTPEDGSFQPFKVVLDFLAPPHPEYRVLSFFVRERGSPTVTAVFHVDLGRLLEREGTWTGQLTLEDVGDILDTFSLVVPKRRPLIAFLGVAETALISSKDGRSETSSDVCTEVDSVSFHARLVTGSVPVEKFTSMTLQARLIHLDSNTEEWLGDIPLMRNNGHLNVSVPCSRVREREGKYEITLESSHKLLTQKTFTVLPFSTVLKGVRAELAGLYYKSNSGQFHPIEKAIFAADAIEIIPRLRIITPFPSKLLWYDLVCTVTSGRKQIHEQSMVINLAEEEFMPQLDEIPMRNQPKNGETRQWDFFFRLNGKLLVKHSITIHQQLPPLAHVQVCLPAPVMTPALEAKPKTPPRKAKRKRRK